MQGASMAIGRHISVNVRAVRSRIAAVESGAAGATASLLKLADTVAADSQKLEQGGPHEAVPEVANNYAKLLADEQAYFEKELTDAVDGRGKRSRKQILGLLAGNRRATGELTKLGSGELRDSHLKGPIAEARTRAPAVAGKGSGDAAPSPENLDKRLNQVDDNLFTADSRALTHIRDAWAKFAPHAKVGKIEYDPHADQAHFEVMVGGKRIFVTANVPPRITNASELATATNRVVGEPIKSATEGRQLLRDLNAGRLQALSKVGLDVPADFALHRPTEFGLGKLADGRFVLVIGVRDNVDWNTVPGLKPVAHSHPANDGNDLKKHFGTDRIPLATLFEKTDGPLLVREIAFPSPSDARIMARKRVDGHRVLTEFVVQDGFVSSG
jgi:hypothetical protein